MDEKPQTTNTLDYFFLSWLKTKTENDLGDTEEYKTAKQLLEETKLED